MRGLDRLHIYEIKTKPGSYWKRHVDQLKETFRKNSSIEQCAPFYVPEEIHHEDNHPLSSPIPSTDDPSEPSQITELEEHNNDQGDRSSPYPRRERRRPERYVERC